MMYMRHYHVEELLKEHMQCSIMNTLKRRLHVCSHKCMYNVCSSGELKKPNPFLGGRGKYNLITHMLETYLLAYSICIIDLTTRYIRSIRGQTHLTNKNESLSNNTIGCSNFPLKGSSGMFSEAIIFLNFN